MYQALMANDFATLSRLNDPHLRDNLERQLAAGQDTRHGTTLIAEEGGRRLARTRTFQMIQLLVLAAQMTPMISSSNRD
jgi:hypothetical protein